MLEELTVRRQTLNCPPAALALCMHLFCFTHGRGAKHYNGCVCVSASCLHAYLIKKLIRRSDSERELFMTTSSITFTQCVPEATKFGEITQNKGHYAVQGQVTNFDTNQKHIYNFLLVINTNFPPILHRFRDRAFDRFKIAIFGQ